MKRLLKIILIFIITLLCSTAVSAYTYSETEGETIQFSTEISEAEYTHPIIAGYVNERLRYIEVGNFNPTITISKDAVIKLFDFAPGSLEPRAEAKILYKPATAESVAVSNVFTDNMVVQRDREVSIWGTSDAPNGSCVTVNLGNSYCWCEVKDGKWNAVLPPMNAESTPQTLTISGKDTEISFENVLVGDVYFVSGQSNMELALYQENNKMDFIESVSCDENIRIYYQKGWDYLEKNIPAMESPVNPESCWENADSDTISKFSAIAIRFAKSLQDRTNNSVPIGLIQTAVGGSSLAANTPEHINSKYAGFGGDINNPSSVYNSMISPFVSYSAKGILWYQGETDSSSDACITKYTERFVELINYWREKNKADLDVISVQLSSHPNFTSTQTWKIEKFRSLQTKQLDCIDNFSLVVSMDYGVDTSDAAHPRDKQAIGERIANIVMAQRGLLEEEYALSPVLTSVAYNQNKAVLTFKNVGDGLETTDGKGVRGFEAVTASGVQFAQAVITGKNTIELTATDNITGVRYGYFHAADSYVANVCSSEKLPLGTFNESSVNSVLSYGYMKYYDGLYGTAPENLGAILKDAVFVTTKNQTKLWGGTIDADEYKYLKINYRNTTAYCDIKIEWTNSQGQRGTMSVTAKPYTPESRDLYVDLTAQKNWAGTITNLEIHPLYQEDDTEFKLGEVTVHKYEFKTKWTFEPTYTDTESYANGFTALNNMIFSKENSALRIDILGDDAYMCRQNLSVDTDKYKKIKIRYKNQSSGWHGQIFFGINGKGVLQGTDYVSYRLSTNMTQYDEVIVDMTNVTGWGSGNIMTYLRLDLANTTTQGTIYVESIEFLE